VAPDAPVTTRVAPSAPEPEAPAEPVVHLAVETPDLRTAQAVSDSTPPEALAVDEQRVRSLNKSLREIALVEPVDLEGLRPADVASELQPDKVPLTLTGSYFVEAHPSRYLYCFSHNPLYFEDANLERCGIAHCCQPVVSAAQFIGRTALLPYSMLVTSPSSCVTTLGDCPTCHSYPCGADVNR